MGQMPKAAETGDCIRVFQGSSVPHVLRPARNRHYVLVGDCYVHGILKGELFLDTHLECGEFALC
jgi:hypothetical protein